jgi:hypothetical protein
MEWVVDANKNVYVYSPGGTLLGSWSAGGLSSRATLTGIATNGSDIWLVDSYSDKVYKYAGAASRLSGSQNPVSSFSLAGGHNGDPNPQDLVTDGTSFWVVDGSKLKVFKYTLTGSLLGSWGIDPADTQPTGITINPNNASDVWIVDSGTDKVYQYVGAAGRTSGSQSAGATFALAAGNTNPQGIADPPAPDMLLTPVPVPALRDVPPDPAFPVAAARGVPVVAAVPSPAGRESVFAGPVNAAAVGVPSAVAAGVPSLASRDAVFALLMRESLPGTDTSSVPVLGSVALTPAAGRALPAADAPGGPKPLSLLTPLSSESSPTLRPESSAGDALDGGLLDEASAAPAVVAEAFAAGQAAEATTEE